MSKIVLFFKQVWFWCTRTPAWGCNHTCIGCKYFGECELEYKDMDSDLDFYTRW